jgi:D-alanyl-D-alanine carboxypeptidase
MMLVEAGDLSLDDSVGSILPNLPAAWTDVTVRHLLSYTSGIPDCLHLPPSSADRPDTLEEIVQKVAVLPMASQPGEKWSYHQTSHVLLGMIIETMSGKPYAEFVRERIFEPLEMTATRFRDCSSAMLGKVFSADTIPNRATVYAREGDTLRSVEIYFPPSAYMSAGLYSSVADLARFDAALYTEKLLKKSSLEAMWAPTRLNSGKTAGYGLGWSLGTYRGHRTVGHSGGAAVAHFTRFLDDKLTIILLTNLGSGDYDLANGIARFYLPAAKPISDVDPKTTRRLKDSLLGLAKPDANPTSFTPETRTALCREMKQASGFYRSLGPPGSFRLIEHMSDAEQRTYRYQVAFGDTRWIHTFVVTQEGKITELGVEPE